MKFRNWRTREEKTLRATAGLLGIGHGANPSRRVQRLETGEVPADPILAEKIVELTKGEVSLKDLSDMRKEFLLANRLPDGAALERAAGKQALSLPEDF